MHDLAAGFVQRAQDTSNLLTSKCHDRYAHEFSCNPRRGPFHATGGFCYTQALPRFRGGLSRSWGCLSKSPDKLYARQLPKQATPPTKIFPKNQKKRGSTSWSLLARLQTRCATMGVPKETTSFVQYSRASLIHLIHSSCRPGLPGPSLANAGPPRLKKSSAQQPTDLDSTVAQPS
jgi:hypothetical protein